MVRVSHVEQCNTQVPIVENLLRNDISICGIKLVCFVSRKATRAAQNAVISPDDQGQGQNGLSGHNIAEVQTCFLEYNIRVGRPFLSFRNWMRSSMAKPDKMRYSRRLVRRCSVRKSSQKCVGLMRQNALHPSAEITERPPGR